MTWYKAKRDIPIELTAACLSRLGADDSNVISVKERAIGVIRSGSEFLVGDEYDDHRTVIDQACQLYAGDHFAGWISTAFLEGAIELGWVTPS